MVEPRRIDLGYRPRAWQAECHRKRQRFTVLALHRRAGKTELAIMELLDAALRTTVDLPLFFYVAPYLKQAKAIAWARLKQRIEPLRIAGLVEVNESDLSVRVVPNGALIRVYGGDNPDAMRGVRLDGVVIDEVAQIKPEVWDDILQPALSDRMGWALFIGTPSGVNLFSSLFFKALADDSGAWWGSRYTVHDTNALDAREVARLRADMNETSFAREYLCDFTAAGDDQLIGLQEVEEASRRQLSERDYAFAPVLLGIDPARFGDDRSVIVRRQGLRMFPPMVFRGIDNMTLADHVAHEIEAHRPEAVFCDAGNGSGVIDRLRQLRHRITEVHFGGQARDQKYLNKRAEMWFAIRDWLRSGGAIPNDQSLKMDLSAPTYEFNAAGKIKLESKDDIKKRGMPSPDVADALAVTFATPVRVSAPGAAESRAITDYSIFG